MSAESADFIILDGNVWTGVSPARADALAVKGDRIFAVGSNHAIEEFIGPDTRTIDARGKFIAPAFIDSHLHFLDGGFRLASVQLQDCDSRECFVDTLKAFIETVEPGEWIVGGDWNHNQWGGQLPEREWIDAVTPNNPVWLYRHDGHLALANSAALERAGVSDDVSEIDGGEIERTPDGSLTGVFKDNAMVLIERVIPKATPDQAERALITAMNHVAENGVGSVHHMGSWDHLAVYRRAHEAGKLITRIYSAVPLSTWERLRDEVREKGRGDGWLRIGGLKAFLDGSLGSKTAAFFDEYNDDPGNDGLFVEEIGDLERMIAAADAEGLHALVHAIGDRANHEMLNLFERVIEANGPRDRRFRIEHAQHLAPADLPRFNALGVIASMQPYHILDDGCWADEAIGPERSEHAYAFRSLLDAGAHVAFGSDWFVAPPTPIEGIYAAATRRPKDGDFPGGWVPQQKITVEEALRAYTVQAAYSSFEEDQKGSLAPGKWADLVIIDKDLTTLEGDDILSAQIECTIVGGKIVYQRT